MTTELDTDLAITSSIHNFDIYTKDKRRKNAAKSSTNFVLQVKYDYI